MLLLSAAHLLTIDRGLGNPNATYIEKGTIAAGNLALVATFGYSNIGLDELGFTY